MEMREVKGMRFTKAAVRAIVKNARCNDCGEKNYAAMAIVNDEIMCANCHQARAFA
jgi:formylmethanofuran dehydrogenase subunit E